MSESGQRNEPKPKLFGPDIFGWGGGLPREGVGAKKFGMSFETQGTKLFRGISRDFAGISRQRPKSLRKTIVLNSRPLICGFFFENCRFRFLINSFLDSL